MVAVLCCGEALIDMVPRVLDGRTLYEPLPGGGALNTAVALGRLGVPTGFLSALGTDFLGERLRRSLAQAGVDLSLCVAVARPCTLAFVDLAGGQPRYAFHDEGTAGRLFSRADLPARITARCLVFGGISLAVEPCGNAYETLLLREAGQRLTMIDPNIRPAVIGDDTGYRARLSRMMAAADIVKLSVEDLHWLAGGGADSLVDGLIGAGVALVLVTDGAAGAQAVTATARVSVPAPRVTVVDTVGAGDTFNAGVLSSLHRAGALSRAAVRSLDESALRAVLQRGIAAASVTVGRAGANPPWAHELD